jgi:hypothetical protein
MGLSQGRLLSDVERLALLRPEEILPVRLPQEEDQLEAHRQQRPWLARVQECDGQGFAAWTESRYPAWN